MIGNLLENTNKKFKNVQNKLLKALERANGLKRVISLLSDAHTQKKVAQIIVNEGFLLLGAKTGDVSLVHEDDSFTVLASKGYPKAFIKQWPHIPKNAALLTTRVIQTKKPYFLTDPATLDAKYKIAKSFLTTTGTQSAAILPLKIGREIIGIMQFNFKSLHKFSREEKLFMNTLATQCAQALERVIAQEDLRKSKEQLEVILRNTADGIIVQDATGLIIYANDVGAQLLGSPTSEGLKNTSFVHMLKKFEITDEQDRQFNPLQLSKDKITGSKKDLQMILKFANKKSKETRYLIVKSTAIYDHTGASFLIIRTLQDITQVKELDQKKDDFISIASHELKTPLTSMKLFLDILTLRLEKLDDPESLVHLEKVKEQTARLQRLMTELLDVSRIQKGKLQFSKENFRIDELLIDTIDELQLNAPFHKLLLNKIGPLVVYGDRFRVYQVLSNLINNAIKYSPHRKKIIIALEKVGKAAQISVKDFGIGIAKEHQEKIFDRFYQTSDAREKTYSGLGMGLYISKEIIKHHDGNIWVESKKGKGSTFYFSLPLARKSLSQS